MAEFKTMADGKVFLEGDVIEKAYNLEKLWDSSDSVKLPLKELFEIVCKKCNSPNIVVAGDDECEEVGGCPTCGSWMEKKFFLALKCLDCGNAKVVKFE